MRGFGEFLHLGSNFVLMESVVDRSNILSMKTVPVAPIRYGLSYPIMLRKTPGSYASARCASSWLSTAPRPHHERLDAIQ